MFNSLLYKNHKKNIFNYANLYPISSNVASSNRLFYNINYKEIVYNSSYNPGTADQTSTSAATYTMPPYNLTLIATASSNSITITLPNAVGISGVMYKIIRTDTTLTNAITINTTSSQTIGGNGTSRKMYTANEVWEFVSNGTNWSILNHNAQTPFIDYGAIVFTTTGSAPGIPTSSYHKMQWKRDGKFIYVYYGIAPTSVPTIGTGNYLFPILPTALSGLTIDTSINPTYTGGNLGVSAWNVSNALISVTAISITNNNLFGVLSVYDQYNVRSFQILNNSSNSAGIQGTTYHPIASTNAFIFTLSCIIPITEFDD